MKHHYILIILTLLFNNLDTNAAPSNKDFFTFIYEKNVWNSQESRSGVGSTLRETKTARNLLPQLFKQLNIKTFLDLPCGDFNWMKHVDLSLLDQYIGGDIVDAIIKRNNDLHSSNKITFKTIDLVNDTLPSVDLMLCRDCLQHLKNEEIFTFISNLKKSNIKYVLLTNYPDETHNPDFNEATLCFPGRCKKNNFQLSPFNFPEPLVAIKEEHHGKHLTLWEVESLPNY